MIITISDMWKNQPKMLDHDNQIKLSNLIVCLAQEEEEEEEAVGLIRLCAPLGRLTPTCSVVQNAFCSTELVTVHVFRRTVVSLCVLCVCVCVCFAPSRESNTQPNRKLEIRNRDTSPRTHTLRSLY